MKSSFIIIHKLIKNEGEGECELVLSDNLLPAEDPGVADLLINLEKKIRTRVSYTIFDKDSMYEENSLPESVIKHMIHSDSESFVKFTKNAMNVLKNILDNVLSVSGGYFIFTDFDDYLSIFLIRDTSALLFRHEDQSFEIDTVSFPNVNKLIAGCRINKVQYEKSSTDKTLKYLSHTKGRSGDVTEYFNQWIGAEPDMDSVREAVPLLNVFNKIEEMPEREGGEKMTREELKKEAYSYMKGRNDQITNIDNLSEHLYNNRDIIRNCALENDIEISTEIVPETRTLKKFVEVNVKSGSMKLNFERELFRSNVTIDDDDPDVIKIKSKELAAKIKMHFMEK